jgi:hypothetical protein
MNEVVNEVLKLLGQAVEILETPEIREVEKEVLVSILKLAVDKLAV